MPKLFETRRIEIANPAVRHSRKLRTGDDLGKLFHHGYRFGRGGSISIDNGRVKLAISDANWAVETDGYQFAMKLELKEIGPGGRNPITVVTVDDILDELCGDLAGELSRRLNPGQSLDLGAYSLDLGRKTTDAKLGFMFIVAGRINLPKITA